jgi:hypothetical protein
VVVDECTGHRQQSRVAVIVAGPTAARARSASGWRSVTKTKSGAVRSTVARLRASRWRPSHNERRQGYAMSVSAQALWHARGQLPQSESEAGVVSIKGELLSPEITLT